MSGTYFCFSDECGGYNQIMSSKQLTSHPFYIRTTLLMNSKEWKHLNNEFRNLKIKYSLPLSKELKWCNLWSIKSYQTTPKKYPLDKEIEYLGEYNYLKLIEFVNESLGLLKNLKEKKIIATYTKNSPKNSLTEKLLLKYHLQEHVNRQQKVESQKLVNRNLPKCKHSNVVIAHRGDHQIFPENSILSIQEAINDGVDYVEIDLRTTLDGRMVLMHDGTVDRMTNGNGKVADLSYEYLKSLKLFNKNKVSTDTTHILSFEEVLNTSKNKVNIYLDFKDADVQKTYAAILNTKMQNQIVVYINNSKHFVEWRKFAPQMPLIISLTKNIKDSLSMAQYLENTDVDILDGNWVEYSYQTVRAAALKNIPVWADMQSLNEDELYWEKGLQLGLKGIQTDHPKELVSYLIKKNIR